MKILEGEGFKSIPFRIYQVIHHKNNYFLSITKFTQNLSNMVFFKIEQNDKPYIQKIFEPISDDGRKKTLEELLEFVFGENYKKCIIKNILEIIFF